MDAASDVTQQTIEQRFLNKALADGIVLRVSQTNRIEHDGVLRDIGRYEINLDVNGRLVTLLKQKITHISAPGILFPAAALRDGAAEQAPAEPAAHGHPRPNVQQEFLDKAVRERHPLSVFLINGIRVRALIDGYDSFTLLLQEGGRQHLYYKHAISTINR